MTVSSIYEKYLYVNTLGKPYKELKTIAQKKPEDFVPETGKHCFVI